MAEGENIIPINIEEEMKTAYIDYSMSVIVSRAIPDVRDGFKPVHRRVLYGMHDLGLTNNKPHKKSARIVGEVLGKYHPHGDSSVYDTMVRMAQDWSLRYPLVDGQGNFGSVDGDSPAAMRYTEARQEKIAEDILADLDKDTVDFALNFDDTLKEPTVLPSKIPGLLVNGASGIAVGMATNIMPHNLGEVIDGIVAYIDNRDITIEELAQHVKAPDFPTGGTIYGYDGVKQAFETGRGRVVVRGKAEFEDFQNHERIIVTEIPYQVNKANLIVKAADLVNEKKIDGISDIRDESDRNGMRIVFELKRDANAHVVLNTLYKLTPLQTSYGVNNIALVNGRPQLLNLKDMIHHFVEFRHEVVVRRTQYELSEAEKKAHVLEGLIIAIDNLDAVIKLIRASQTTEEARTGLMKTFELSEIQARAILDMRLQKLTGLERDKLKTDYDELLKRIAWFKEVLDNEEMRMDIIKEEMAEVKRKYADPRRSEIEISGDDINIEDLIPNDHVVVTISHQGYIKRTLAADYKVQNRGGKGSRGGRTKDEDFIEYIFSASMHNYMLFFTELGRCFWLKVYNIPEGSKTSKGRPIQNVISIPKEDKVKAFINVDTLDDVDDYLDNRFVVLCTRKGVIKKTTLRAYSRPRVNGIIAVSIREGDYLLEAKLTNGNNEIMMAKKSGKVIRFHEGNVRPMGRNAAGVRGVRLENDKDEVVGMICVEADDTNQTVLVVSEKGYGKRTYINDPEDGSEIYRITKRGGKGVKTMNVSEKTGSLIAIKNVTDENDIMIINRSGLSIRMSVADLRVMGRATQGVRLIRLNDNDEIASLTKMEVFVEEELLEDEDDVNTENPGEENDTDNDENSDTESED
ncbi:MAG: DNA gyrase subunit A [Chitinophagales bacterium]